MTFFTVITRGLIRRPVRTGLTILGISVGIGAVVAEVVDIEDEIDVLCFL